MNNSYKLKLNELIRGSGVEFEGDNPWDIKVLNPEFYRRTLIHGSMGLGESYMEGWWECRRLDQLFDRLLTADINEKVKNNFSLAFQNLKARLLNLQTISRSSKSVAHHYDIGNDLYREMLGINMMYSCGYWDGAKNLDEAQNKKLEMICEKLKLSPGMKVLDIGCGWGGFVKYAAENYDVDVLGITLSKAQAELAKERCKDLQAEIRIQDYRNISEKFDRIVSIGMFEHVGFKNHKVYMEKVYEALKDNGITLIHTIGSHDTSFTADPWIHKYIFPNGLIPSAQQVARSMGQKFILQDWHNFGKYYDTTLMAWLKRFKKNWPRIKENYNETFYRMWIYYLSCCAGAFRANHNNLWQIVLTKKSFRKVYRSFRYPIYNKEGRIGTKTNDYQPT
ncbi:cyclopropane fatty acyl phospholipid synthase [Membranihabitans maritimus]|uniref:cyclopropane fatty acyl phospholipid synthase n=1 Tax=Membranihabitans maritimus TaxID=2904244 RepID=UPI001F2EB81E|nr:cyclopropane fatty acyl phospholipid synthase [Membranihabitans maritimus]